MTKLRLTLLAVCVAALTGCASGDYKLYAEGQSKIESAKYLAEAERWKAMGSIAANGTESAKIAAVVAMAMSGQQGGGGNGGTKIQAPQANEALQWASLLVPSITQLAGISANVKLGMAQSDNAARVAMSTNDAFVGIAGKIQAPAVAAANVTTTTTTNTTSSADVSTTFSGTGVLGSGSYATAANPTTTTTSSANPTTTTTTTNANPTTTTTTTNANPTTTTTTGATVTCTGNTVTTGNQGCPTP